jgi:hypothetical protein
MGPHVVYEQCRRFAAAIVDGGRELVAAIGWADIGSEGSSGGWVRTGFAILEKAMAFGK